MATSDGWRRSLESVVGPTPRGRSEGRAAGPARHDLDAELNGGVIAAIEIISEADQTGLRAAAAPRRHLGTVTVPGSQFAWLVEVTPAGRCAGTSQVGAPVRGPQLPSGCGLRDVYQRCRLGLGDGDRRHGGSPVSPKATSAEERRGLTAKAFLWRRGDGRAVVDPRDSSGRVAVRRGAGAGSASRLMNTTLCRAGHANHGQMT